MYCYILARVHAGSMSCVCVYACVFFLSMAAVAAVKCQYRPACCLSLVQPTCSRLTWLGKKAWGITSWAICKAAPLFTLPPCGSITCRVSSACGEDFPHMSVCLHFPLCRWHWVQKSSSQGRRPPLGVCACPCVNGYDWV